ncbi:replication initiation protein [Virgisporangium aliadipatigenens]|uniref:Replication initiation protein n=1 Tax=Virgisporangium aliadipatigenens TaxID=741659 RepID=A0A8J3YL83_9ACTN|nr:replication initiator [Virgisporangium aliadipatigenens]GIJ47236.1 replication initiation protein [Virgisporangium aliadipatigenens]
MTTFLARTTVMAPVETSSRPGSHPTLTGTTPTRFSAVDCQPTLDTRPPRSALGLRRPSAGASAAEHAFHRATAAPDVSKWLHHVKAAAGCTSPVRLSGEMWTVDRETGVLLSRRHTTDLPDAAIYKPCGNRRATVCLSCAERYRQDAYQILRSFLVGGKGIPVTVAQHPAVFATFTAPSFGTVHTRHVDRHTCIRRNRCDCRPEPCHARRNATVCPHGTVIACYARHDPTDPRLGQPLCPDCYDHHAQVVWNNHARELWRRTTTAVTRAVRARARQLGHPASSVRLSYGNVAEMQRRGVVHFHAVIRLDGHHPDVDELLPPPEGLGVDDLVDALTHAVTVTRFHTGPHPANPNGWPITWGDPSKGFDVRPITVTGTGEVTDSMAAGYLAKYATKATEITGHTSRRLASDTIGLYANPDGTHPERLIDACWTLGNHRDWAGLRRWAHMLGFGGHFLTKSRRHVVTFQLLRDNRIVYRRQAEAPPGTDATEPDTTLVVNFLTFVGAGWHTTGDALLANTAAALARERQAAARDALTDEHPVP